MHDTAERIILYTSNFCGHAQRVANFLAEHAIPVKLINVDAEPGARAALIELNNGYASVPTLVFPDGSHLTEPSLGLLRTKLQLGSENDPSQRIARARRA